MPGEAGLLIAGRYVLLALVGQGGMGRVWRGRDQVLEREVAVKEVLLPSDLAAEVRAELLARTMREARAAARIEHPSVITVYNVAEHDGTPWIVMRLISGPPLNAEIQRAGTAHAGNGDTGGLPWQRVAEIGAQVADALAHAHAAGITHRDLKPANILLDGPRAVLTDFGIAHVADATTKLTGAAAIIGTPPYMAPEQFDDLPVSPATDMWALGATLYAATEGHPPFAGATMSALMYAVVTKPPIPPRRTGPLTDLVHSLLAKDPAQRPDARTVAKTLATLRTTSPAVAAPAASGLVPDVSAVCANSPRLAGPGIAVSPAIGQRPPAPAGLGAPRGRFGSPRARILTVSAAAAVAAAAIATAVLLTQSAGPPAPTPPAAKGHPGPASSVASHSPVRPSQPTIAARLTNPDGQGTSSVAFSPDGRTLVTGAGNGNAYLWNTATHTETATFINNLGSGHGVNSVAFSPDGKTLATGDQSGNTYLWNTATRADPVTLPQPGGAAVTTVAFSPDGTTLATGDWGGSRGHVFLWNVATHATIADFSPDGGYFYAVAFSPDGKTLATGDMSGSTYLWDVATRARIATLTNPSSVPVVDSVAFSPDGKTLAVGDNSGSTYLWDIATKKVAATLPGSGSPPVTSVAFAPDGKTLATTGDGGAYLWNVATRKRTTTVTDPLGKSISVVTFAPDGTILATGGGITTYLWRISDHAG